MKKLTLVLAMAFTMGLAVSTVSAAPKDKKAKSEATTETKSCTKDSKAGCSTPCAEKKAETK